ncbi:ribosome biogenesis GTP-binding protein YihA/YsxC [Pajaroellobacter abortibovis]|uniref:Probable GTP-binding protein EngB n=1 Tax=Pajaroellobacter abortibovis TaxID=1882918 RepID=A0A1L6MY33_9BACT|nr:ribosome biogenesis GTP-binding protein YihA/YsxC [Pajaroellobacter abortibovis]APS00315.1 ribosome biogenesis GTP-binding protein YsxC [Pajaroellobacter abortibovis]
MIVKKAVFLAGVASPKDLLPPMEDEVAFAGRSNVGKSSLLNRMMERKDLARVSKKPGCTRHIHFFAVQRQDGDAVRFVDLPGYGYAHVSKTEKATWGPLLESYLSSRANLRALILLVDVRRGIKEEEEALISFIQEAREPGLPPIALIPVATKLDKLAFAKRKLAMRVLYKQFPQKWVGISSISGEGQDLLWQRIQTSLSGTTASTVRMGSSIY